MADYSKKQRTRNNQPAPEQAFVESIFGVIADILRMIFKLFQGSPSSKTDTKQQVALVREHWQQIELLLLQDHSQAQAVSEADKLLDAALQIKKFRGNNLGERLKAAKGSLSQDLYNDVWEAHKLRNRLAHEIGTTVSPHEAKQAVNSIRAALYQYGIL